jgi:hypothetical protein
VSSIVQVMDAIASQLQSELCGTANPVIPELQVDGRLVPNVSTPALDVYPSDPFTEPLGFGIGNEALYFTVRARVSTSDNEGGQDLLLAMMDPESAESVEQALFADQTLGGVAHVKSVEGPSAFGLFQDPGGGAYLGCTWRVRVHRS